MRVPLGGVGSRSSSRVPDPQRLPASSGCEGPALTTAQVQLLARPCDSGEGASEPAWGQSAQPPPHTPAAPWAGAPAPPAAAPVEGLFARGPPGSLGCCPRGLCLHPSGQSVRLRGVAVFWVPHPCLHLCLWTASAGVTRARGWGPAGESSGT